MKITLKMGKKTLSCQLPYKDADHVTSKSSCPKCGAEPLNVRGGISEAGERGCSGPAKCVACEEAVGQLHVEYDTIFGFSEDQRILHGPWKVY